MALCIHSSYKQSRNKYVLSQTQSHILFLWYSPTRNRWSYIIYQAVGAIWVHAPGQCYSSPPTAQASRCTGRIVNILETVASAGCTPGQGTPEPPLPFHLTPKKIDGAAVKIFSSATVPLWWLWLLLPPQSWNKTQSWKEKRLEGRYGS